MPGQLVKPELWKVGLSLEDARSVDALQRGIVHQPYDLELRRWFDLGRSGSLVAQVVRRKRRSDQVVLKFCSSTERVQRLHDAWDERDAFCSAHLARVIGEHTLTLDNGMPVVFMEIAGGDLSLYQPMSEFRDKPRIFDLCGTVVRSVIADWNDGHAEPGSRTVGQILGDIVGKRVGDVLKWESAEPRPGLDPRSLLTGDYAEIVLDDVLTGKAHGDLSSRNVLVNRQYGAADDDYRLIDYDHFAPDAALANDPMHLLVALALDDFEDVRQRPQEHIQVILDPRRPDLSPRVDYFRKISLAIHDAVATSLPPGTGFGANWEPQCLLALAGAGLVHLGRELKFDDPRPPKQWCYDLAAAAAAKFLASYPQGEAGPDPPAGQRRSGLATDMLGRDNLYRRFRSRLAGGSSGIVLVRGLPGMGKTKMLETTIRDIRAAGGGERQPAIREHLATPERRLDLRTLIDLIGGESAPAIAPGGRSSLVRLEAVLDMLGRTPVIVAVDSAENLLDSANRVMVDPDLDEAFEMLKTERNHRVSVILASQQEPVSPAALNWPEAEEPIFVGRVEPDRLAAYLRDLDPQGALGLDALPPEHRERLLRSLDGNPRLAELVYAVVRECAVGLPKLISELPTGGDSVTRHILELLIDRIDPRRRDVLLALAALGTPVRPGVVANVLDAVWEPDEVAETLQDLVRNHVCRNDGEQFFLPSADADLFLGRTPRKEKRGLLFRSAATLHELRVRNPRTVDDMRIHFAAIRALIAAGERKVAHEVIEEADEILRAWNCSYLLLDKRLAVQGGLTRLDAKLNNENAVASIYLSLGQLKRADKAYGRALKLAEKGARPADKIALHNNLGLLHLAANRTDDAQLEFADANAEAIRVGDVAGRIGALQGLAVCHRHHGEYDQAIGYADDAVSLAEPQPTRRFELTLKLARWHAELGNLPTARERLTEAEALAARCDDDALIADCREADADLLLARNLRNGEVSGAVEKAYTAVDLAIRVQNPFILRRARTTLCVAHLRSRNRDEAERQIRRAVHYRRPKPPLIVLALLALVTRLGRPRAAGELFDRLLHEANKRIEDDPRDFSAWDFQGLARCGRVLDGRDDIEAAVLSFRMGDEDGARPYAPGLTARLTFLLELLDEPGSLRPAIDELNRPPQG